MGLVDLKKYITAEHASARVPRPKTLPDGVVLIDGSLCTFSCAMAARTPADLRAYLSELVPRATPADARKVVVFFDHGAPPPKEQTQRKRRRGDPVPVPPLTGYDSEAAFCAEITPLGIDHETGFRKWMAAARMQPNFMDAFEPIQSAWLADGAGVIPFATDVVLTWATYCDTPDMDARGPFGLMGAITPITNTRIPSVVRCNGKWINGSEVTSAGEADAQISEYMHAHDDASVLCVSRDSDVLMRMLLAAEAHPARYTNLLWDGGDGKNNEDGDGVCVWDVLALAQSIRKSTGLTMHQFCVLMLLRGSDYTASVHSVTFPTILEVWRAQPRLRDIVFENGYGDASASAIDMLLRALNRVDPIHMGDDGWTKRMLTAASATDIVDLCATSQPVKRPRMRAEPRDSDYEALRVAWTFRYFLHGVGPDIDAWEDYGWERDGDGNVVPKE